MPRPTGCRRTTPLTLYPFSTISKPDDIGFEKETIEKFDLFTHKPFQLPNFRGEQIKQLAISP